MLADKAWDLKATRLIVAVIALHRKVFSVDKAWDQLSITNEFGEFLP
jgi:hypothetical protein